MTFLTDVYVNIAGSGEYVLSNGTANCAGKEIINCRGIIVPPGIEYGVKYVVGSAQKIYYDVLCIEDQEPYKFKLKEGDSC